MTIEEYCKYLVKRELEMHKDKVKQFKIEPFDQGIIEKSQKSPILMELSNVWGSQRYLLILNCLKKKVPFYLVIGFKSTSFHLAHLALAREVGWYVKKGGIPYLIGSLMEKGLFKDISDGDTKNKMENFLTYFSKYSEVSPSSSRIIFDLEDKLFVFWAYRAATLVRIGKISQLFGWSKDETLARFWIAISQAITFLYPQLANERSIPTLVFVDPFQAPYVELAKILAQKLKILPPSALYHSVMPNLKGNNKMSAKDKKNTIFLDEENEKIRIKLFTSASGGKLAQEQKEKGGDIEKCIFFRIIFSFLPLNFVEKVYIDCQLGKKLCS